MSQKRTEYFNRSTGLPTKILLTEHFEQTLADIADSTHLVPVLTLSLDKVNSTKNEPEVVSLIKLIAEQVLKEVKGITCIAQVKPTQLALTLASPDEYKAVSTLTHKIMETLRQLLIGSALLNTASIGIALYPCDGSDLTRLLTNAGAAMSAVKKQGGNDYRFYTT